METANQSYPEAPPAPRDYSKIPEELRALRQWVAARHDKAPVNPRTGQLANVMDPTTWATFDEACKLAAAQGWSIGFVLAESDPYCIVDLDDKENKPASDADRKTHARILEQFNTYTEYSRSGRGYHVVMRGSFEGAGRHRGTVEVYSRGRHMIFTGDAVRDAPITDCAEPLAKLVAEMPEQSLDVDLVQQEGDLTDAELHERASSAANGVKYSQLARGEWQAMGYPSQSEADFALLSMLAFYSCDNEQVRRVFRCTALGKREKAARNDAYLNRCLKKIRAQQQADQPSSAQVEAARQSADSFWRESSESNVGAPASQGTSVNLIRAADVKSRPVDWLWRDWIARRKLHILAGAPGTGKTTIALNLAACISTGRAWPAGVVGPEPGNVVIWSGEDEADDTLKPRLVAAGADLNRVYFVNGVGEGSKRRTFDPATDMLMLAATLAKVPSMSMIIVDPIVSAVAGDSHKNAETRRSLQPLVDLAMSTNAAVVGISHFTKGTAGREPLERVAGSLAFGAVARVTFGTVKLKNSKDPGERYMFVRVKTNLSKEGDGFVYNIEQVEAEPGIRTNRIEWGRFVEGTPGELFNDAEADPNTGDRSASAECAEWLQQELSGGSRSAKDLLREANEAGYTPKVLRRAREKLGIKPIKVGSPTDGGKQRWVWALPGQETEEPDA